tara:strand:+ start:328 stop:564 length:237 start_codon:yes stop_codon:yes gene_type:complete
MTTVTCTKCNNTIHSKHEHDYHLCGCDNQTYVCGNTYGGQDMKYVVALTEPKEEKETPRVGRDRPRRRTTRMSDVIIR